MREVDELIESAHKGEGAVTYEQCPDGGGMRCKCGRCAICGNPKHTAIHGPAFGGKAGDKPASHEFIKEESND